MAPPAADGGVYFDVQVDPDSLRSQVRIGLEEIRKLSRMVRGTPDGMRYIETRTAKLVKELPLALAAALYEELQAVLTIAKTKTPVDTGRLRASGYVSSPERGRSGNWQASVGFGTDYAIFVHERTELRHTSGEAKFLESAINERAPGFGERLAKRTWRNFQRGTLFGAS